MRNSLRNVLDSLNEMIGRYGIVLTYKDERADGSYSVNLDSTKNVGTIVYWPDAKFEFQFNSCITGDVVFLESKEFNSEKELSKYVESIILKIN